MEHEFERQLRTLAIERRPEACLGCGFEHGCSVHGCAVIHAAVNRLAAYEETRLEPEDMKKAFNEDTTLKLAGQILGMSPDRLRELAQAEKTGRLVVLPCKVGDTVYRVGASICKWREIDHCDEYCDGWQYRDCWEGTRAVLEEKFSLCDLESIGKTVFLTREAAEAALEEMGVQ